MNNAADTDFRVETYRRLNTLQTLATAALLFLVVFVVSMTALMVYVARESGENASELRQVATETHGALCTLRADVAQEQAGAIRFLKQNPEGAPALDLSAADIQRSINDRNDTLEALGGLKCKS